MSQLERYADADAVLAEVGERMKGQAVLEAEVAMARADVALRRDQPGEARRFLDTVLSKDAGPELTRTAQVKLAAMEDAVRRPPSTRTSGPARTRCDC
ncbi:hypothetical protein QEG98_13365 [Myxococcus sp. MxC21-1]|uniref:hypothetical protein n=1 Tax=Myxococcus sp. MxC21-1 TaxID=3041439 RepID=UPI00292E3373|nr:hypothetical protein [Myxococcus sp. MxC21-1]WNZ64570.1 hypothetical protein QEG98_13365 [Myxococcus sp. MxC21-1]